MSRTIAPGSAFRRPVSLFYRHSLRVLIASLLFVGLGGCADRDLPQPAEFTTKTADGSIVTATIQYRPKGCAQSDQFVDCYYYIVNLNPQIHFDPKARSDALDRHGWVLSAARTALVDGRDPDAVDRTVREYVGLSLSELESKCEISNRLFLRFFDSHGFSLYRHSPGGENALAPGWNDNPDHSSFNDGVWRWNGRFSDTSLPAHKSIIEINMTAELRSACE